MFNKHYVYEHRTADGRLIYVGIGKEGRAWEQTKRDPYHRNMIQEFTHDYVELTHTGLERSEALRIERRLIRNEDPCCNICERIK